MNTLFDRLGGFAVVHRIVSDFYDRVLENEVLAPYFEQADMRRLIDHQTKFISAVMGGPASYSNESLRHLHAPHQIDRTAFEEMRKELKESLLANGVPEKDCLMVIDDIEARAPYVISRT
jgi:hemoglobin